MVNAWTFVIKYACFSVTLCRAAQPAVGLPTGVTMKEGLGNMRCRLPALRKIVGAGAGPNSRTQNFLGRGVAAAGLQEGGSSGTVDVRLVCEPLPDDGGKSWCCLRAYCPETNIDISDETLCDRLRNRCFSMNRGKSQGSTSQCAINQVRMVHTHLQLPDGTPSADPYMCLQFWHKGLVDSSGNRISGSSPQLLLGMPLSLEGDEITMDGEAQAVALEEKETPEDVFRLEFGMGISKRTQDEVRLCDNVIAAGRSGYIVAPVTNYKFSFIITGADSENRVPPVLLDLLHSNLHWNGAMLHAMKRGVPGPQLRTSNPDHIGVFQGLQVVAKFGQMLEFLDCREYEYKGRDPQMQGFRNLLTDRPLKVWVFRRSMAAAEAGKPYDDEDAQTQLRAELQETRRFYRIVEPCDYDTYDWDTDAGLSFFRFVIETGFSPQEILDMEMLSPESAASLRADEIAFQEKVVAQPYFGSEAPA